MSATKQTIRDPRFVRAAALLIILMDESEIEFPAIKGTLLAPDGKMYEVTAKRIDDEVVQEFMDIIK